MLHKGFVRLLALSATRSYHSSRNTAWMKPSPRGSYAKSKTSKKNETPTHVVLLGMYGTLITGGLLYDGSKAFRNKSMRDLAK